MAIAWLLTLLGLAGWHPAFIWVNRACCRRCFRRRAAGCCSAFRLFWLIPEVGSLQAMVGAAAALLVAGMMAGLGPDTAARWPSPRKESCAGACGDGAT